MPLPPQNLETAVVESFRTADHTSDRLVARYPFGATLKAVYRFATRC